MKRPVWAGLTRSIRAELNLSQEFVARKAGISQGYLSQLESGDVVNPSLENIRRLAFAFGLPLHYLLRRARIDCGCEGYEDNLAPLKESA